MFRALIVAEETERIRELSSGLAQKGFACSVATGGEDALEQVREQPPDLLLIAVDGSHDSGIGRLSWLKRETGLPALGLVSRQALLALGGTDIADDFVVEPWDAVEVLARARLALRRTSDAERDLIRCGDLVIDPERCEVSLSGRQVPLTFREYELLRFLAGNRGKVFTREALLNRVWGYDYYGGDRTVDVHIRRLRSKIEDPTHTFIETVRNIGYRLREEA